MNMNPATERQIAFINSLLAERVYAEAIDFDTLTTAGASALIEALKIAPKAGRELALGMYQTSDGEIYRVKKSRETGRLYAMRLDVEAFSFVYAQGAIYRLTEADRMDIDEARAFGRRTGYCCVCGRFLVDPVSVANGIGPICEGRM